jgi:hypothetical protein
LKLKRTIHYYSIIGGAILFYDIGVATDYKKDGWKWQRRKDGSGRV